MTSIAELLNANIALERRDVEVLLGAVLNKNRAYMYAHGEHPLTSTQSKRMSAYLSRLKQSEPAAYLLGEKEFYNINLEVTNDVLIPRPETELLVDYALEHANKGDRILDLGTGSGAIALALAAASAYNFQLSASDICDKALNVARRNARTNKLDIEFLSSDWLDSIDGEFELILCNPPYIAEQDVEVETGVHNFEPHLALYSGPDGLNAIREIIQQAPKHLVKNGTLVLEHGWQQAADIQNLFNSAGYNQITTVKDLAGLQRVTRGNSPEQSPQRVKTDQNNE